MRIVGLCLAIEAKYEGDQFPFLPSTLNATLACVFGLDL
jgi:hypothetical protein